MPGGRADANDAVVGHNIRAQRLARGMSQTALGREIGVTFQQVRKYEKGVNRVGSGRLVRVAGALNVRVTALLKGVAGQSADADPSVARLLAHPQRLRLVQAFLAINDKDVRRSLVNLTEGIARLAQRGTARK